MVVVEKTPRNLPTLFAERQLLALPPSVAIYGLSEILLDEMENSQSPTIDPNARARQWRSDIVAAIHDLLPQTDHQPNDSLHISRIARYMQFIGITINPDYITNIPMPSAQTAAERDFFKRQFNTESDLEFANKPFGGEAYFQGIYAFLDEAMNYYKKLPRYRQGHQNTIERYAKRFQRKIDRQIQPCLKFPARI